MEKSDMWESSIACKFTGCAPASTMNLELALQVGGPGTRFR